MPPPQKLFLYRLYHIAPCLSPKENVVHIDFCFYISKPSHSVFVTPWSPKFPVTQPSKQGFSLQST